MKNIAKREPYIWLQEGEGIGIATCGCKLITDSRGAQFFQCKMHEDAYRVRCEAILIKQKVSDAFGKL